MGSLVRMCYCDSLPHKAFHHYPPITLDTRTDVLTLPVAPSESESYCECSRTCCEVEDRRCECGHRDDDHYERGGCRPEVYEALRRSVT